MHGFNKKDMKVLLSIFGPIAILFLALVAFQYRSYQITCTFLREHDASNVTHTCEAEAMLKEEALFTAGAGGIFMIALTCGGFYFRSVYKAKARAEAEAAYQTSLAEEQRALAAEKEKLEAVINSIPDGIILLDEGGGVMAANSRIRDILGVSPRGRLMEDISEMPDDFPIKSLVGSIEDGGERVIGGRTYRVVCMPVLDAGQGGLREIRLLRDITLEKSLEQKKADLVSMITHDVKSPMTAIIGMCQWLKQGELGSDASEDAVSALDAMSRASTRIMELMDGFVLLTSLEGMKQLNRRCVDLNEFLGKALLEFQMQARNRDIRLEHCLSDIPVELHADEPQLMRALANVLNNALKYTPDGGNVSVSARKFKGYATITVTDDGPGIDKNDLPYIFDRYYRAAKTEGIKGSGLGLAIAKAVVEAHDGSIDVSTEEGRGATFTFRLPLCGANMYN